MIFKFHKKSHKCTFWNVKYILIECSSLDEENLKFFNVYFIFCVKCHHEKNHKYQEVLYFLNSIPNFHFWGK